MRVERRLQPRKAAHHRIGRQVHDRGKGNQANDGAAPAPATSARHHRQPFTPRQPEFVLGEPRQGSG